MATNDHGSNWCTDHSHGERGSGIWHDSCKRVAGCVDIPSQCPTGAFRLLDQILCNHCIDDKDDTFAKGKGLDWIPENCCQCRPIRRIFEQTVTYRKWQEPLMYADDEPHTMWAWNPLSKNKH